LTAGTREGLFERGNHVVDYWLAHCEGFKLGKKRVTGVVCDQRTGHARTLLIESGLRKSHPLPARAIAAVDPFNKVLYLEPRATRRELRLRGLVGPHARRGAVVGMATARGSVALAAAGLRIGGRHSKNGALWLGPRLGAAARTSALLARKWYSETALWLAPRLAAVLRAVIAGAYAFAEAARRRWSARR
jgi:hypothetical protein